MPETSPARLTLAPMEGLTGIVFRRRHHAMFPGADAYYTPFVTPTREPRFTERQIVRELSPEGNAGIPVIPQLLTRRAEDFLWAARELHAMGYREVNLNLGCPMGTVTAKGKGSGFLRDPAAPEAFLEEVFRADLPLRISVKTRLGWASEAEFEDLVRIYNRFPISELIVHARLRTDFYRGSPRLACLRAQLPAIVPPVGYNGDLVARADLSRALELHPGFSSLMVGRAAIANPAFFRFAKGGEPCSVAELFAFHDALLEDYSQAFGSLGNSIGHMKQYWFYMKNMFEGGDKLFKALLKAKRAPDYRAVLAELRTGAALRSEPLAGWGRPASIP